jgi:opacity protein-like surface antigen
MLNRKEMKAAFVVSAGDRRRWRMCLVVLVPFLLLLGVHPAWGQSEESANAGRAMLSAGVAVSGFTLQYGDRKMLGITAWVDADTIRRFGVEGEMRRLEYHQTANVHAETYLAGVRYHFNVGRMQPYIKALGGDGRFNFPYNFATGNYFVVAGGGGLDYRLSHRWTARADFEYQEWPQFTFGAMNSVGGTVGIRYRIF